MSFSMSHASLPALEIGLTALSGVLDKAEAHAAAKKIDPPVLLGWRLAPDMFPLVRQIQIATDIAKKGMGRLAGAEPPVFEDNETTIDQLKTRIAKTVTFLKSLDCLAPLGLLALFGQSSGSVEPLNLGLLAQKGSLYVTRPTLFTYGAKRENLVAMAKELFEVVQSGAVKIEVNQTYPLKDAARAHADLAARKTTGSTVLLV